MESSLDISNTYKIQEKMMTFMGVWHIKNANFFNRFMKVFSWTVFLISYIGMTSQVIYSITDFAELCQTLYMMTSYTSYFCKLLGFSYKRKAFLFMLDHLENPIFKSHPLTLEAHLSKTMARSILITKIYRFCCFSVVGLFTLYPLLDNATSLPAPIPFDLGKYTPVMYVIESLGLLVAAWNNFCLDTLCTSLMGLAYSELDVLKDKIIGIRGLRPRGLNLMMNLMQWSPGCYRTASLIIVLSYCSWKKSKRYFPLVCSSSFWAAWSSYATPVSFLLMISPASFQFGMLAVYFVTMMIQLSLYCWYGNEIILKSAEIRDACYLSEWYTCGVGVRKLLFIMMERSKRPLSITAWKFSKLSLSAFTAIIQWSYSYFALLQRLASKQGLLQ